MPDIFNSVASEDIDGIAARLTNMEGAVGNLMKMYERDTDVNKIEILGRHMIELLERVAALERRCTRLESADGQPIPHT